MLDQGEGCIDWFSGLEKLWGYPARDPLFPPFRYYIALSLRALNITVLSTQTQITVGMT